MVIKQILIWDKFIEYLEERRLIRQYKKAKKYILSWNYKQVDFKLREPKKDKVYYFRINKQFRAYATVEEEWVLKIYHIDNHQN